MSRISPKPPMGLKVPKLTPAEIRAGKEHMGRVKQLPCVVCHRPGPSDAHHCIHGRYGTRKATDFETIPLCVECHRYPFPGAIHSGKETWRQRYGADYEYLSVVADMLAGEWNA